ncbi:MAG: hypothetical protein CL927_00495 [Deltaproteobacteria bacterium]|nr:hypothetical protein [Deltaproteobacteria bacterium]
MSAQAEIVVSERNEAIELGAWSVRRRLGRGGMGTVYHCYNPLVPDIEAAVKTMDASMSRSVRSRKRFIREAEVLFSLDHPHIVKVRNVHMDHMPPFLEMDFVAGTSLGALMAKGALTKGAATSLAAQMSSAVHYLHSRGVFHRDIKPDNIILAGERSTLVDFGLVSEDHQATLNRPGALFGTLQYVPPEWGGGSRPSGLSWDRYSLGIVIYEAFTGHHAFERPESGSLLENLSVVQDKKRAIPHLDPGPSAPDEVRWLVRALTARDPLHRVVDLESTAARLRMVRREMSASDAQALPVPGSKSPGSGSDTWHSVAELGGRGGAPTAVPETGSFTVEKGASDHPDRSAAQTASHAPGPNPTLVPRHMSAQTLVDLPMEPQEAAPALASEPRRRAPVGVALAVAVAAAVSGLLVASPSGVDEPSSGPTAWPLERVVLPETMLLEVSELLDGKPISRDEQPLVEAGNHTLRFVIGTDCDASDPGPHCHVYDRPFTVGADGTGARRRISLPAFSRRMVQISSSQGAFRVRLDDRPWTDARTEHRFDALLPGVYAVVLQAGECPDQPCLDGCPASCVEEPRTVVVPYEGTEPVVMAARIQAPARPVVAAPQAVSRGLRGLVSVGRFERWLERNTGYGPNGAQGRKQSKRYLIGWDGLKAPSNRPGRVITESSAMVDVSAEVARRFCDGHGGLQPVDAAPQSWPITDNSVPMFEFREGTSGPVVIGSDGAVTVVGSLTAVQPQTGFRCRR